MDSNADRQRNLLGAHVTAQLVAFVLALLGLVVLIGLAVLGWLETAA